MVLIAVPLCCAFFTLLTTLKQSLAQNGTFVAAATDHRALEMWTRVIPTFSNRTSKLAINGIKKNILLALLMRSPSMRNFFAQILRQTFSAELNVNYAIQFCSAYDDWWCIVEKVWEILSRRWRFIELVERTIELLQVLSTIYKNGMDAVDTTEVDALGATYMHSATASVRAAHC